MPAYFMQKILVDFITQLEDKSEAIKKIKKIIEEQNFKDQMVVLHEFKHIPENITELEAQGLKVKEQVEIVNKLKSKLDGYALEKLNDSLRKNPDFVKFTMTKDIEFCIKTSMLP